MDIFQIPGLTGWPGVLLALVGIAIYVHISSKYAKNKIVLEAEEKAKNANKDAIDAMQAHLNILKERVKETEDENVKLRHLFDTMNAALKSRGLYVTIDGEMIHIHDIKGESTTIHISKSSDSGS